MDERTAEGRAVKPDERNADALALAKVPWQVFATFTLRPTWTMCDLNDRRFRAAVHLVERGYRIRQGDLQWFLALEGVFGTPHFHGLIAGFPPDVFNGGCARFVADAWYRKHGGFAYAKIYDASKGDGIGYQSKKTREGENVDRGSPWYSESLLRKLSAK